MKKVFCLPSKASFILPVTVTQGKEIRVQTTALVDSGAYAVFVHHRFVKEHGLKTNTLGKVIHVYNADGSRNRSKTIEEYVWLDVAVGFHVSRQACLVTDLGNKDMFLGYGGDKEFIVNGYVDASFDTDPDDSKSQTRYVFTVNGEAVSWCSSKKSVVAGSTCEAEYIAASEAANE